MALIISILAIAAAPARARFSFRLGLRTSSQWSDNVYSASENEEKDINYTVSPSISLDYFGYKGDIFITLSASRTRYRRLSVLDRDSLSSNIDATYRLSRRTRITFSHSFSYNMDVTTQTREYEDIMTKAGVVTELIQKDVAADQYNNDFKVTLFHDISSRTHFTVGLSRKDEIFSNEAFDDSDSTSVNASLTRDINDRDRVSLMLYMNRYHYGDNETDDTTGRATLGYLHRQNKRLRYTLDLKIENNINKRPVDDKIFKSQMLAVTGGMVYRLDPRWTIDLNLGIRYSRKSGDLSQDEEPNERGHTFSLELRRTARRSTLTFRASRNFNPAVRYGFETTYFAADYVYDITPRLRWSIAASYSINESSRRGGIDTSTRVLSSTLVWNISDRADISVEMSRVDQESSGGEAGNVKRNTVLVSLNLRYPVNR